MRSRLEQEFENKTGQVVRLNKFISEAGICSRRKADELIDRGQVLVDGQVAEKGMKIFPGQEVKVGRKVISQSREMIMLAVNKPVGIVCTAEKREKHNIVDFIGYPRRIYPVGRLDKDSEGLILMTNNGDIVNEIMRARNQHEKEYIVKVDKEITREFLERMGSGVPILDTVTRPCRIEQIGKYTFRIILTQGLNRQIRRMCEYLGYEVTRLKRVRIMNIRLGDLKPGQYRDVSIEEMEQLYESIRNRQNERTRQAAE